MNKHPLEIDRKHSYTPVRVDLLLTPAEVEKLNAVVAADVGKWESPVDYLVSRALSSFREDMRVAWATRDAAPAPARS